VEGLSIKTPVAILNISDFPTVEENGKLLYSEDFVFLPEGGEVRTERYFGVLDLGSREHLKENFISRMVERIGELKRKFNVERVYINTALPLYRGLSTKREEYAGLYRCEVLERMMEETGLRISYLFNSYTAVFIENWESFKNKLKEALIKDKERPKKIEIALAVAEGTELLTRDIEIEGDLKYRSLTTVRFVIIPTVAINESYPWVHHAFLYSEPTAEFLGCDNPNLRIETSELKDLINLLLVIHLTRYEKFDIPEKGKGLVSTAKRNPYLIFPQRMSSDKNIANELRIVLDSFRKKYLETPAFAVELYKVLNVYPSKFPSGEQSRS
jgi:hypothetical protein